QPALPQFPATLTNHLASPPQGRPRYRQAAVLDFPPEGQKTGVRFANGAIRVRRRFTYEQVFALLEAPGPPAPAVVEPEVYALLLRMRELAMILRQRRLHRGALELTMPEVELEYDEQGRGT